MNKLIIDDVEYNLEVEGVGSTEQPSVIVGGVHYVGIVMKNYSQQENDFEILSFKSKEGPEFELARNHDGTFGPYSSEEADVLESSIYTIKSVKRLSNGEVFNIGDKCIYRERGIDSIKELKIENDKLLVYFTSFATYLPYIEKVAERKVVFIIEDGDAKEGTKGFAVHTESSFGWNIIEDWLISLYVSPEVKQFNFRSNAENYVLMNRPCLSVNEIDGNILLNKESKIRIIEMAKNKINATT